MHGFCLTERARESIRPDAALGPAVPRKTVSTPSAAARDDRGSTKKGDVLKPLILSMRFQGHATQPAGEPPQVDVRSETESVTVEGGFSRARVTRLPTSELSSRLASALAPD